MTGPNTGRIKDIRGAQRGLHEVERSLMLQSTQQRAAYRHVTANDAIETSDVALIVDATAGMVSIFLPEAGTVETQIFYIVKTDASANVVRLDADGTELISGAATRDLTAQWQAITIMSIGDAWVVL